MVFFLQILIYLIFFTVAIKAVVLNDPVREISGNTEMNVWRLLHSRKRKLLILFRRYFNEVSCVMKHRSLILKFCQQKQSPACSRQFFQYCLPSEHKV